MHVAETGTCTPEVLTTRPEQTLVQNQDITYRYVKMESCVTIGSTVSTDGEIEVRAHGAAPGELLADLRGRGQLGLGLALGF